jgi:hypothetical protein
MAHSLTEIVRGNEHAPPFFPVEERSLIRGDDTELRAGMIATMKKLALVLVLVASPAVASMVVPVNLEELVHSSSSIAVGRVTRITRERGRCSLTIRIDYATLRGLEGLRGSRGSHERTYQVADPGCPSGSFVLYDGRLEMSAQQTQTPQH